MDIKSLIEQLTNNLINYNYHYHTLDKSLISDEEYDKLFHQLLSLEAAYPNLKLPNSPTALVGSMPLDQFRQKPHSIPMLSLNNIFSDEQLINFDKRINNNLNIFNTEYVATPKYDGIAISLLYTNGILTQALTRGDGVIGEDVTLNVQTINNIPKILFKNNLSNEYIHNAFNINSSVLEVRGEVLIKFDDFIKLNQIQQQNGAKIFANARNAAAGSIRQLNSQIAATRPLHFFAYAIAQIYNTDNLSNNNIINQDMDNLHNDNINHDNSISTIFNNYHEQLLFLQSLGFDISDYVALCNNHQVLINYYHKILSVRTAIAFGIDGVVYKVNDLKLQEQLGYVARAPKFAIAHKFPSLQSEAQIIDINIQIGRTGALTPVAKITPAIVNGVVITSVTLHNFDEIKRHDIRLFDYVYIERAGDVIPKVANVILQKRELNKVIIIEEPSLCPICQSKIIRNINEVQLRCSGHLICTAQKKQSILHFVSKQAMNIDGFGTKTVDLLVDSNIINNIVDIYRLTYEQLIILDGFAEIKINKLLKAINESKNTTLTRLIYALGINHIGIVGAKSLANIFGSIDNIISATLLELININDIGEVVATSIIDFFHNQNNIKMIQELLSYGINYSKHEMIIHDYENKSNDKLTDTVAKYPYFYKKTFVITGSLENFTRDEMKIELENRGSKVINSISKNVDYLIVGVNAGSKLTKALELNITILSENEINKMFKN